nr:MAG TPA: hypothetical protein [Caudoviricetes sp.]
MYLSEKFINVWGISDYHGRQSACLIFTVKGHFL